MSKLETHKLYNGKVTLKFDEEKHVYTVDDKKVEGATGVTGIINKPALIYWAVNQAIGFLQNALKAGTAYDELELETILNGAKSAHRNITKSAGDIGTLVHKAIENYINTGVKKAPVNAKAKKCFEMFLEWADKYEVEFLLSEKKVYSRRYEYAGTCDFVCNIKGKLFVGDIKTSSGIWDEMWFQVAGYQQALEEEFGTKYDGQVIVRVGKDGAFEVQYRNREDYEKNVIAFNGALALYKRIGELKDEAVKLKKLKGGEQ